MLTSSHPHSNSDCERNSIRNEFCPDTIRNQDTENCAAHPDFTNDFLTKSLRDISLTTRMTLFLCVFQDDCGTFSILPHFGRS
jgi:hypothetical protein